MATRKRSQSKTTRARRPARSTSSSRTKTPRGSKAYERLKFESRPALRRSLESVRIKESTVGGLLDAARRDSPTRALALARGILDKQKPVGETRDAVRGLVRWSTVQTSDASERRRTICRAFKSAKSELLLVHGISEMGTDDARELMRTYFAEGGDVRAVAEWLQIAGAELRRQDPDPVAPSLAASPALVAPGASVRRPTRRGRARERPQEGLWDTIKNTVKSAAGAVADFVSDAADTVADAVSTVVDAVISAGKSVADAVAAAAAWTVEQVTDLARALLNAGKSVASILTEALAKGLLRKFVDAIVRAGRAVGEVLLWAVQKTASVIRDTVTALLAAGRTIYDVLTWAAGQVMTVVDKVVQALIDAGKTVAQVMADAVHLTATLLRRTVMAVYRAVQAAGDILVAVARSAVSVIRTVLEGLFMVGVTLVKAVASICQDVVAGFRRGFFEGLMALGHAVVDILKAAAVAGASVVALAFSVVMEIFGGHRALTAAERQEARRVFGWSIDLDRVKIAVASIPADVVNWLNGQRPFTTMYVINFASGDHITMATLIHELTHVWQAVVAGPVYMVEALHSQFFGRGYQVTADDIAAAAGDITKLEREQQAVVVERYWQRRWGGVAGDWHLYEPLAKNVYKDRPASSILADMVSRPLAVPVIRTGIHVPRLELATID